MSCRTGFSLHTGADGPSGVRLPTHSLPSVLTHQPIYTPYSIVPCAEDARSGLPAIRRCVCMNEMIDMKAMSAMRFAMRCQLIDSLLKDMGAVPEGLEMQVGELSAMAANLKANAFSRFLEDYEVRMR